VQFETGEGGGRYPPITSTEGQISAIDLNRAEILWQVPVGEYKELSAKGLKPTGVWSHELGGGGFATPASYEADGRQFVVIATSPREGAGKGPRAGFTAFALAR